MASRLPIHQRSRPRRDHRTCSLPCAVHGPGRVPGYQRLGERGVAYDDRKKSLTNTFDHA